LEKGRLESSIWDIKSVKETVTPDSHGFVTSRHSMAKKQEIAIPQEVLMSKTHEIRGVKVMFDRDLAAYYGVETRVLK